MSRQYRRSTSSSNDSRGSVTPVVGAAIVVAFSWSLSGARAVLPSGSSIPSLVLLGRPLLFRAPAVQVRVVRLCLLSVLSCKLAFISWCCLWPNGCNEVYASCAYTCGLFFFIAMYSLSLTQRLQAYVYYSEAFFSCTSNKPTVDYVDPFQGDSQGLRRRGARRPSRRGVAGGAGVVVGGRGQERRRGRQSRGAAGVTLVCVVVAAVCAHFCCSWTTCSAFRLVVDRCTQYTAVRNIFRRRHAV